jgi:ParB family chromosome partitioning protein
LLRSLLNEFSKIFEVCRLNWQDQLVDLARVRLKIGPHEVNMSKMNKPRLGRGLSSLLSVSEGPSDLNEAPSMLAESADGNDAGSRTTRELGHDEERVVQISVEQVTPNPHQPRRDFDETALQELAASLKTNGVIQPIVVRALTHGFELIAGERRLRAARIAGLKSVPAIVKNVDGLTQTQWALVENIQREDLNPIDRAQAYKSLLDQLGLSHGELANRLGVERSSVSNHLRLLELPVAVQELLRVEELTLGHAKVLAGVADALEQERLGKLVVSQQLSVRNLEQVIHKAEPAKKEKSPSISAHLRELERKITSQLGLKVGVKAKKNGSGRLVINYKNLGQFDDLMRRLNLVVNEE